MMVIRLKNNVLCYLTLYADAERESVRRSECTIHCRGEILRREKRVLEYAKMAPFKISRMLADRQTGLVRVLLRSESGECLYVAYVDDSIGRYRSMAGGD